MRCQAACVDCVTLSLSRLFVECVVVTEFSRLLHPLRRSVNVVVPQRLDVGQLVELVAQQVPVRVAETVTTRVLRRRVPLGEVWRMERGGTGEGNGREGGQVGCDRDADTKAVESQPKATQPNRITVSESPMRWSGAGHRDATPGSASLRSRCRSVVQC